VIRKNFSYDLSPFTYHSSLITYHVVKMSEKRKRVNDGAEVVNRRSLSSERFQSGDEHGMPARQELQPKTSLAPGLTPLLVGFVLLLVLIGLLGYFSRGELDTVETGTAFFQIQYTSEIEQLLSIHAVAIGLDSEARVRSVAKLRGELTPPLDLRLGNARIAVEKELGELAGKSFADEESWRVLRQLLERFVETTRDLRGFSLDGYAQFREVKTQIATIQTELAREPLEVSRRSEELRSRSVRRVTFWWVTALLIGLVVSVATVWEVQRRFRREQESAEEARRERHFSTQVLKSMVSAVAAVDMHAHIRSANLAFFKLFPAATVGASVYDSATTPEARRILEIAVMQRADEAGYRGRWPLVASEANETVPLTYDLYTSPLEMDGEQGQIITLVDVSDAVATEALLRRSEALAAVGQASAQVAHEIRNPLGSIRLGVSMLRDMTDSKEAITTIDLVERGIDHLNKLVVDVTRFSREKPLARTKFDLHKLLDSSLELVADRISEKQQHIRKQFSTERLVGEWDEDQLRQVFVNLLANAIDASKKNAPVIVSTILVVTGGTVEGEPAESESADGERRIARVTISDEGDGMDDGTRLRIFEPFFTTKKRGTGLGLAIVKQIVDRHSGTISVQSEPGKGAAFVVDLPLVANDIENR
jgi:signal transduction histidine kinase